MQIWPGRSYPLGATYDGNGVNFAVHSPHATGVDVCLFDSCELRLPDPRRLESPVVAGVQRRCVQ